MTRAAQLAGQLAPLSGLSMRQIKRVLERVELALLIYAARAIDFPLLIWLAFLSDDQMGSSEIKVTSLLRTTLSPQRAVRALEKLPSPQESGFHAKARALDEGITKKYPELTSVEPSLFRPPDDRDYHLSVRVFEHLAPHYIPEHQDMLDAVHKLQADA